MRVASFILPLLLMMPLSGHAEDIQNSHKELTFTKNFPLPARSTLTPGKVINRTLSSNPFTYPFFIVGDDALSREWLQKNAERLQALRAIGFITNVTDKNALDEITALAGLPLQAMDIDELAEAMDAGHYPFAVEEGALWQ